jgi:hypothetical protein
MHVMIRIAPPLPAQISTSMPKKLVTAIKQGAEYSPNSSNQATFLDLTLVLSPLSKPGSAQSVSCYCYVPKNQADVMLIG